MTCSSASPGSRPNSNGVRALRRAVGRQQLAAGTLSLDGLIRAFVRERLAYRFVVTAASTEAARLERAVRRGALSAGKPYLNPLSR
jgi:hypothetical protein